MKPEIYLFLMFVCLCQAYVFFRLWIISKDMARLWKLGDNLFQMQLVQRNLIDIVAENAGLKTKVENTEAK